MYDDNRGSIKYPQRYKQLISYEGMVRHRKITPTDIDGLIDYNGSSFIYIEGKLIGKDLDYGQRKALENVVKSHGLANHFSMAIIFNHNCSPNEIIIAKDKFVKEIYTTFTNKWIILEKNTTVLEIISQWEYICKTKGISI